MKNLGLRTAQFHRALAQPDAAGAFGADPVEAADIAEWVNKVRREMDVMFVALERALPNLSAPVQELAISLLAQRAKLYRRIVRPAGMRLQAMKTRCHGNYHLGQVWRVNNDVLIANYGGEPGQSWEERRRKHTPLFDVAGMLASLGMVGTAALVLADEEMPELGAEIATNRATNMQRQVDAWEKLASKAFFRSYRQAMKGHPTYPAEVAVVEVLLTLFLAEKVIAELSDALNQSSVAVGGALRRLLRLVRR